MRVRWTTGAKADLKAIGRYIAQDDPRAARRWVARLRREAREAGHHPRAARMVPEFMRDDVREVIVGSYRIVYQILDATLAVLTVFEGHRLLPIDEPDQDDAE